MKSLPRYSLLCLLFAFVAAGATARPERSFDTPPELQQEVRTLIDLLQEVHYNRDAVKPADYAQLIPDFMSELDGQRLFFQAGDKEAFIKRYGQALVWNLGFTGKLDAAFDIYATYEKNVENRVNWINAQLEHDFDFTVKETYPVDRSKGPWTSSAAELDDLWRRRIKFELLQDLLNDKPLAEAKKNVHRRYERMLKNLADLSTDDIAEIFLTSLARLYDPHSNYFSAENFEDFGISMRLSLVGIGALLGTDDATGECVVKEIIPGGPADLSNQFHINDRIFAVTAEPGAESVDIIGMKLRKIVDLIRGEKGTKVTLSVHPASEPAARKDITLVRDLVKLNQSRARAALYDVPAPGGGTIPIGVITLPSFYGPSGNPEETAEAVSASKDVAALITQLNAAGIKAMVLDLRRNGGGLLSEAIDLTGLFIRQGPVVQVKSSYGDINVDSDDDPHIAYTGPLAVLVSRFSASASEIVAGALQNYGRAIIVGDSSTHGKGSVQTVREMKELIPRLLSSHAGAVKFTIQKFYLPNGASTQMKGVISDIVLPSVDEYLPIGEADLPHALGWDEIKPSTFDGAPLNAKIAQQLREESLARQSTLEEFTYLKQDIARFKTKQDEKDLSLNLEERRAGKKADDTFRKSMEQEKNTLAKNDFHYREFTLGTPFKPEKKPVEEKKADEDDDSDSLYTEDPGAPAKVDIPLRESLRVMIDVLDLSANPHLWASDHAPLTVEADKKG